MDDRLPSEQFRKDLADELRTARKNDPRAARMVLGEKKKAVGYRLAEGLLRQEKKGPLPAQREPLEEKNPYKNDVISIPYSNELSLFETFEYLKNIEGVGLGVGMDQMLDIAVNSNLSEIIIVDIAKQCALTTQALLETGRRGPTQSRSLVRSRFTEELSVACSNASSSFGPWRFSASNFSSPSRIASVEGSFLFILNTKNF